jgi:hypothetical protein
MPKNYLWNNVRETPILHVGLSFWGLHKLKVIIKCIPFLVKLLWSMSNYQLTVPYPKRFQSSSTSNDVCICCDVASPYKIWLTVHANFVTYTGSLFPQQIMKNIKALIIFPARTLSFDWNRTFLWHSSWALSIILSKLQHSKNTTFQRLGFMILR